jgi:diguanylate cyclase (GGDEF)-like protein
MAGFAVAFALLKSGRFASAAFMTAIVPVAMITCTAATGGGVRDLSFGALPVIILYVGLTQQRRAFLGFIGVLVGATVFVVLNQQLGWLTVRGVANEPFVELFVSILVLGITALGAALLANSARTGLETAHHEIERRKEVERELAGLSSRDALTDVYSRRYFEDELARLRQARSYPVSIVMADVDDLKIVNDQLGHAEGDRLLVRAAALLSSVVRIEDVLARIGGDEFAIILPETDERAAAEAAARIDDQLRMQRSDRDTLLVELSVGVATATSGGLAEAVVLADRRMYESKAAKKSPERTDSRR